MDEKVRLAAIELPGSRWLRRRMPDFKKFYRQNKEIVHRLGAIIIALLVFWLIVLLCCHSTKKKTVDMMEAQFQERIAQERIIIEEELKAAYGFDKIDQQKSTMELEAEALAKMLYPMQYNSRNGLRSACWCVFNRVESAGYPDSVMAVCSQSQQFMGWSEDNPVLSNLYDLAMAELETWHNSATRPMNSDYVYLEWTNKEITLRTKIEGGHGSHEWYEDDWND